MSLLLTSDIAWAEADIAIQQQAKVLVRALAYDRGLKERAGGSVDIGIVFSATLPGAEGAAEKALAAFRELEKMSVQGMPVKASILRHGPDLPARLKAAQIDALYLLPGLDGELASILATTRELHITSLGGKREYVEQGAAVGVFVIDDKPTILVNVAAAKAEGAQLGSDLLKLARLVQ